MGAIFDFTKMSRIECLWFVGGDDPPGMREGDWMAAVYKKIGEQEFSFTYRFRYYKDERAHHSDDEKSVWHGTGPREKLIQALDDMAKTLVLPVFGGPIYRKRFVDGSRIKAMRWISQQPFSHTKTVAEFDRTRPQ